MGEPDPRDLDNEARGRAASRLLTDLEPFFASRRKEIRDGIFAKIASGDALLEADAVQAWLQLYEVQRLEDRLKKAQRRGATASARLADSR